MSVRRLAALMLCLVACGGAGSRGDAGPPAIDAPRADANHRDADLAPNQRACGTTDAAACPDPYVCANIAVPHSATDAHVSECLIPCSKADDCPASCCCQGFECGSDMVADGYCACL